MIESGEQSFGFKTDIALGIGKVYTRSGHWQSAREWLLLYLAEARQENDIVKVTQGYGALGELLLRAGHSREALACLSTAFHILPTGSGQQSKQHNYLASALVRNREWLRADTLLKTSIQNARYLLAREETAGEAADSIHHALARLQFMELSRHGAAAPDIMDIWSQRLNLGTLPATPVAQGFLSVGRALRMAWREDHASALILLEKAQCSFNTLYPMERYWIHQLIHLLTDKGPVNCEAASRLIGMEAKPAPHISGVLDETWRQPLIAETNGFSALFDSRSSFDTMSKQWHLFFL